MFFSKKALRVLSVIKIVLSSQITLKRDTAVVETLRLKQNRGKFLLFRLNQLPKLANSGSPFITKNRGMRPFPRWLSQFNASLFYRALCQLFLFHGSREFWKWTYLSDSNFSKNCWRKVNLKEKKHIDFMRPEQSYCLVGGDMLLCKQGFNFKKSFIFQITDNCIHSIKRICIG